MTMITHINIIIINLNVAISLNIYKNYNNKNRLFCLVNPVICTVKTIDISIVVQWRNGLGMRLGCDFIPKSLLLRVSTIIINLNSLKRINKQTKNGKMKEKTIWKHWKTQQEQPATTTENERKKSTKQSVTRKITLILTVRKNKIQWWSFRFMEQN